MRASVLKGATVAALALAVLPATAAAEETTCTGTIGATTVDNLRVPQESVCRLDGTYVKGTVKAERAATLDARSIRVVGNVQGENAARVIVSQSEVGGSIQVKQGGGAEVTDTRVTGDIQLDQNDGSLQRVVANDVNGSVQVVKNVGGVDITRNLIDGNLQCKENVPAPVGGGNVVQGNAEDQCASLAGGSPGGAGPGSGQGDAGDRAVVPLLASRSLRASRSRRSVRVPLRCPRVGPSCVGRLSIRGRSARFRVAGGARKAVRVSVGRRDRAALRRSGRLRVKVIIRTAAGTVARTATVRG